MDYSQSNVILQKSIGNFGFSNNQQEFASFLRFVNQDYPHSDVSLYRVFTDRKAAKVRYANSEDPFVL